MSTFGTHFRVTTYGESHCRSVGCIVDGVPAGLPIAEADIQPQMSRRRPGQSAITTPRDEKDRVQIQSGTENGVTLGTPVGMIVLNENQRPKDYGNSTMDLYPRPSHADWTYLEKYGIKASSGGGRSSARETIGRVAASAIAEKYMTLAYGIEVVAFVSAVGDEQLIQPTAEHPAPTTNPEFQNLINTITREKVDSFLPVRCPSKEAIDRMESAIADFRDRQDSCGGAVTCVIRNLPAGLGEPCFDKFEAKLAHAMMSIPATKSFEIGIGAGCVKTAGSQQNDPFGLNADYPGPVPGSAAAVAEATPIVGPTEPGVVQSRLRPTTNNSGGVQGGITNGAPVYFTVSFKPAATIGQSQSTSTYDGTDGLLEAKGRHDPCVVPRAVPIVEAMASLVAIDALMGQEKRWWQRIRIEAGLAAQKEKA